jgi:hypothetical protein
MRTAVRFLVFVFISPQGTDSSYRVRQPMKLMKRKQHRPSINYCFLAKLFAAWTDRMETSSGGGGKKASESNAPSKLVNGIAPSILVPSPSSACSGANFIFTHSGRHVDAEQTPEEAGMEDGDEILVVELMDLTEAQARIHW